MKAVTLRDLEAFVAAALKRKPRKSEFIFGTGKTFSWVQNFAGELSRFRANVHFAAAKSDNETRKREIEDKIKKLGGTVSTQQPSKNGKFLFFIQSSVREQVVVDDPYDVNADVIAASTADASRHTVSRARSSSESSSGSSGSSSSSSSDSSDSESG